MRPSLSLRRNQSLLKRLSRNITMPARCEPQRRRSWLCHVRGALAAALATACAYGVAHGEPRHAIAMHGEAALPANFTKLRYANPAAPKGGRMVWGLIGTFDSLNPLIVKGISLPSIRGYVVESLMARGYDEPFTLYGLVAQTVETD